MRSASEAEENRDVNLERRKRVLSWDQLKPYFQLVRLPNVFSASADSISGFLIAGGSLGDWPAWLPLALASAMIYAAGIALNDYCDIEIDRKERPGRPLPSGRVSLRFAAMLGWGLLLLGPAAVLIGGTNIQAGIAAILAFHVLVYDVGLKRTPLGPELMGACRGLNLLLGLSAGVNFGGAGGPIAALSAAFFVTGITWISRWETETGRRDGVIAGTILQLAGLLGLAYLAITPSWFSAAQPGVDPYRVGLMVLGAVSIWVMRASLRALIDPNPQRLQRAVKLGVLSLIWLNVGLVAAVRGPAIALLPASLWIPAFLLGRKLYST